MATLYFYKSSTDYWSDDRNWFTDISHSVPAYTTPTTSDDVVILTESDGRGAVTVNSIYCVSGGVLKGVSDGSTVYTSNTYITFMGGIPVNDYTILNSQDVIFNNNSRTDIIFSDSYPIINCNNLVLNHSADIKCQIIATQSITLNNNSQLEAIEDSSCPLINTHNASSINAYLNGSFVLNCYNTSLALINSPTGSCDAKFYDSSSGSIQANHGIAKYYNNSHAGTTNVPCSFYDYSSARGTFSPSAYYESATFNVNFYNNSYNRSFFLTSNFDLIVEYNFYNNSYNDAGYGNINLINLSNGRINFHNNSWNAGSVSSKNIVYFYDNSYNIGEVSGSARFYSISVSIKSLVDWNGKTGFVYGDLLDAGGNIFAPELYYIDSNPAGDIYLSSGGNIYFYGSSENHYTLKASSIQFFDNSSNYGSVVGSVNSEKTNYSKNIVLFNDYSSNHGYSGNDYFGGIYSITRFNNYSTNASEGTSYISEFEDSSYNYGTIPNGYHVSVYWPTLRPLDGTYDLITYYKYPLASIFTNAASDGDWSNLANWTDEEGNPAYFLPDANSIVTINEPVTQSSSTGILAGIATFKNGSYFDSGLTLRGSAKFTGNSYNSGLITRSASFEDTSYNDITGEISGDITLENYAYNLGYVAGNAYVIYPSPYPIEGNVIGTTTYRNYPRSVVFTGAVNGDWANLENWKDVYNFQGFILPDIYTSVEVQAPITQISSGNAYCSTATFKQGSYWGAGITLRGNAAFTGNSYNAGTILRNASVYFPSPNPIGGTVNGTVSYYGYTIASIFTGAVSGDWANINNWTNADGTAPFYLPNTSTNVTINAAVTSCSSGTIRCKTASFRNSSRLGSGLTLYGHAYFYNTSTNAGTINGDADVYFPAPNPLGGTVTGKITYHNYSQGYIFNNTAKDGDWANLANWQDGLGESAVILPTSGINVTINAPITQISSGSAYCATATFNAGSYWGVGITLNGNASFTKKSYNRGTITGAAGFTDSSYNQGSVGGGATFSYNAYNIGTVTGNSVFNDLSYNNGTITGNATFNQLESIAGDAIDKNGYANGVVSGTSYDKYGNTITAFRFYNTHLLGTVTGNAKVYYPLTLPLGGTVTGTITYIGYEPQIGYGFQNTAGDGNWGNIANWVYSTDGVAFTRPSTLPTTSDKVWINAVVTQNTSAHAYCADAHIYYNFAITLENSGTAYFGGSAINTGTISGVASFGSASENQGTCSSATEFNDESINYGSVNSTSNFYFTSANNGDLYGNASFHDYSFVDSTGVNHANSYFYNYSFSSGVIASGYFNNLSYNVGSATYGEFNDTSYNYGNINGNAKFNYVTISNGYVVDITSYASGYVSGLIKDSAGNTISLWIFNTTNLNGVVQGNASFYNSSICNGLVTGNASFYDSSSNTGEINGNATVYYPVRTPLGGVVHGTITYVGYAEEYDFLTVHISLNPIQDSFSVRI
jgi:hypothetical protein